jgi:hypothetical protein
MNPKINIRFLVTIPWQVYPNGSNKSLRNLVVSVFGTN